MPKPTLTLTPKKKGTLILTPKNSQSLQFTPMPQVPFQQTDITAQKADDEENQQLLFRDLT